MTSKPATAFAPGETKGKSIGWESILNDTIPAAISTFMPTTVRAVGAAQVRSLALIPENVTRGVVTLERVRGQIDVYFSSTELAASFANWPVHMQVQLIPVQNGAAVLASTLTPSNSADQESNRIVWQRLYMPRAGTTITGAGAVELHESNHVSMELDIKVKRRFDRALWALQLVVEGELNALVLHQMSGYMRAIFRTADGI